MSDVLTELAASTDTEIISCFNRIMSAVKATRPEVPITEPGALKDILQSVALAIHTEPVAPKIDEDLKNPVKSLRLLLIEFLEDSELKGRVEGALAQDRSVLVEPITTALVMAGVVLVLTTRFKIAYKRKNGKSELEVEIGKDSTSESVLKKLFKLF